MLRIYDEFLEDEVILALKHPAYRVHVSALIYCSRNLTDGEVSDRAVKVLQATLGYQLKVSIAELVAAGLWVPMGSGYRIRNYLEFNSDAETVKKERAKARERMRKLRGARARSGERDGEHTGERSPAVPLPSHALAFKDPSLQAPTRPPVEGHDEKLLKRLLVATGARAERDVQKIIRTLRANRSTEREIVCAIDAATGPGIRDPLAAGLAELKKLATERKESAA